MKARLMVKLLGVALTGIATSALAGNGNGNGNPNAGRSDPVPLEVHIGGVTGADVVDDGLGAYVDSVFGGSGAYDLVRATLGSDFINFDSAFPPKKKRDDPGIRRVVWNFPAGGPLAAYSGALDTGFAIRANAQDYVEMDPGETRPAALGGFLWQDGSTTPIRFRFDAAQSMDANVPFGCPTGIGSTSSVFVTRLDGTTWEITSWDPRSAMDGAGTACFEVGDTGAVAVTLKNLRIWMQLN